MFKTYRYRESWGGGSTSRSLKTFEKHKSKIGNLVSIKGYVYFGKHGVNHSAVMLTGTFGTMRLGGFSWGYNGEGPRGLRTLLENLKIREDEIQRVLKFEHSWTKTGVVWEIKPEPKIALGFYKKQNGDKVFVVNHNDVTHEISYYDVGDKNLKKIAVKEFNWVPYVLDIQICVNGFYEMPDGKIALISYADNVMMKFGYRLDGESSKDCNYEDMVGWKRRSDLQDYPNAIDPRLPYVFDLHWDIKFTSQLNDVLSKGYHEDIESIRELAKKHNLL